MMSREARITDEAVEAALNATPYKSPVRYFMKNLSDEDKRDLMRASLGAALPHLSQGEEGGVWNDMGELPEIGSKFIALYDDGSGAGLFFRHDDGFIDSEGDDFSELGSNFDRWAYLPSGFDLWCENAPEPVQLPYWHGPALASHEPAPTDANDELERVDADANAMAWGAELKSAEARILELETDLEIANDKVERLQGILAGTNKVITGMSRDFTAAHESAEARIAELVKALEKIADYPSSGAGACPDIARAALRKG